MLVLPTLAFIALEEKDALNYFSCAMFELGQRIKWKKVDPFITYNLTGLKLN
jgi:hypothetical protein